MRRSRRIYKRKSRSNLETLIILVGAIVILSVAFYMAREKSFLPPEETKTEQQIALEEENIQEGKGEQEVIEELLAQNNADIDKERENEQTAANQDEQTPTIGEELSREEPSISSTEQTSQVDADSEENQDISEATIQEETRDVIDDSAVSGSAYTVQVGYFSVENNARSLAREIEDHGFQTFILRQDNAYKVQVGAYQSREQAERASEELKSLGYEIWVTQR
ncbi:MAG: SPOR domain-containing protein [Atribacterota bacterium]